MKGSEIELIQNSEGPQAPSTDPYYYHQPKEKPKRRRREWVYKDDYNTLQKRLHNTIAVAYLGWIVLIMYITFDTLT